MPPRGEGVVPDRNLALDIARTTEAAALAAARWVGRGDKNAADGAAVDAMRLMFNSVPVDGIVVIGEGEKDEAPMLFNGEHVGTGEGPAVDIAVDPIDGTGLTSRGQENALSVVAVAPRGTMFDPGPAVYMEKIAVGAEAADAIDLSLSLEDNVLAVAAAKRMSPRDITVTVLDRPRHEEVVQRIRALGSRVHLITDGDVAGAILAALPGLGVDMLYGIGGTPEGVVAAAALRCVGGQILGRLYARDDAERAAIEAAGYDLGRILTIDDLVSSDDVFFAATGVTDGVLLEGVRYRASGATSESIVMRGRSGTIRRIKSEHHFGKLMKISDIAYGDRPM